MVLFDLLASLAWVFSSLAVPEYIDGDPSEIPYAAGNTATCRAQAFGTYLAIGALFYNVCLALYYR